MRASRSSYGVMVGGGHERSAWCAKGRVHVGSGEWSVECMENVWRYGYGYSHRHCCYCCYCCCYGFPYANVSVRVATKIINRNHRPVINANTMGANTITRSPIVTGRRKLRFPSSLRSCPFCSSHEPILIRPTKNTAIKINEIGIVNLSTH